MSIRARLNRLEEAAGAERDPEALTPEIACVLEDPESGDLVVYRGEHRGRRYTAQEWAEKRRNPPPGWGSITRRIVRPADKEAAE